jgi:hypothetical protein
MRLGVLSIGFVALLAGCGLKDRYSRTVSTWVGASEAELVLQWGAPSTTHRIDGRTNLLTYRHLGRGTDTTTSGRTADVARGPERCATMFMVVDGWIAAAGFQGDDCK